MADGYKRENVHTYQTNEYLWVEHRVLILEITTQRKLEVGHVTRIEHSARELPVEALVESAVASVGVGDALRRF